MDLKILEHINQQNKILKKKIYFIKFNYNLL